MPQFLMTYRGPKDYVPTNESTSQWRAWFDSMGERVVELGMPVRNPAQVGNCASETTELGGFSIIEATDLDDAMTTAKGCPHLDRDGGVEIGLLVPVPPAA